MTDTSDRAKHDPFEIMKFALTAYDAANVHAMRLWYAASLVSVPILTTAAGLEAIPIEGFNFDVDAALPPLLLILAALNLVFVVAQVSHYRMAYIYSSLVDENYGKGLKVTDDFTWRDLFLSARIASHNRIMPILEYFGLKGDWISTKILKSIFDVSFGLFPAISLFIGLLILPSSSPLYFLINAIGLVSLLASLPIFSHALKWATGYLKS